MSSNQKVYGQVNMNGRTVESFEQTEMKYQLLQCAKKLQELSQLPADQVNSLELKITRQQLSEEGVDPVIAEMLKDGRNFDSDEEALHEYVYGFESLQLTHMDMAEVVMDPEWKAAGRVWHSPGDFSETEIRIIEQNFKSKYAGTKFLPAWDLKRSHHH